MKVFFGIGVLLLCLSFAVNGHCAYKANASPVTVVLASATASRIIVFSPPTEDLIIQNNNTYSIYVDLKGTTGGVGFASGDFNKSRCFFLEGLQTVELYSFITDGITIYANGTDVPASPVAVLAIF